MQMGRQYWVDHVSANKQAGISGAAYAKLHGISVKALYYWQRKLNPSTPAKRAPPDTSNFVALRVAHSPSELVAVSCMLVMSSGLRLEMSSLPSAEWLSALNRTMQSVR
jgi:hypothetical protein